MKFGFSTLGCPDWPVEKVASEAKRLGYDGVEIRGIKRVFDLSKSPEFSDESIDATQALFADAGLEIVSIDSSAQFCKPDGADRDAAHAEAERHIEIAAKIGAPFVRVFGGYIPEGESREKWSRELAKDLSRAGAYAADRGVTVILETHDDWTKADNLIRVMEMVSMPSVRALWDFGNGYKFDDSLEHAAELYKDYVVHTHVKDFTKDGTYVAPGEGIFPFEKQIGLLKKIGYSGYLSLEWEKAWHEDIAEPEEVFPKTVQFLKKVVASV